jgi:4-diphosphocytidyl-2-C-methyl-D-erythritol kinase
VSTAYAYGLVTPRVPLGPLKTRINNGIEWWKDEVSNAFESELFKEFPELHRIKAALYENGAVYTSMSGSGSAMYGIFKEKPERLSESFSNCFVWSGKL